MLLGTSVTGQRRIIVRKRCPLMLTMCTFCSTTLRTHRDEFIVSQGNGAVNHTGTFHILHRVALGMLTSLLALSWTGKNCVSLSLHLQRGLFGMWCFRCFMCGCCCSRWDLPSGKIRKQTKGPHYWISVQTTSAL